MGTANADPSRDFVLRLAEACRAAGGRAYLVGGCVRDALMGRPALEHDVEVYGLEPAVLAGVAARLGHVEPVGRAFGVLKLIHDTGVVDLSVPRRESKSGRGHKGFLVDADPALTPIEASRRRDLTINAMMQDPLSGELLDFHGGQEDLKRRILRHVSEAFAEDPLRVLRVMQFAARFEFDVAPETVALCRTLDLSELPRERIFEEWRKMLIDGIRPSRGLEFLRASGALRFFPELEPLIGCPQDPEWHPEGDVWTHLQLVMDAAAELRGATDRPLSLMLGALCHDLGKPGTTEFRDGRWRSHNHESVGEAVTRRFLARLTAESELVAEVVSLVREHLKPALLHRERDQVSDGAVRRLAQRVDVRLLVLVARADHNGRGLPDDGFPAGEWLLARAAALDVRDQKPRPILYGRHLLAVGHRPGPRLGEILRQAFEAQLDGAFDTVEGAIAFVQSRYSPEGADAAPGHGAARPGRAGMPSDDGGKR